jgi:hypothetical protein
MFGGGAGHIYDMITRFKENYELLNKNKNYNRNKKYYFLKTKSTHNLPPVSNEERIRFEKKMNLELKKEKKHFNFIVILALNIGFNHYHNHFLYFISINF